MDRAFEVTTHLMPSDEWADYERDVLGVPRLHLRDLRADYQMRYSVNLWAAYYGLDQRSLMALATGHANVSNPT